MKKHSALLYTMVALIFFSCKTEPPPIVVEPPPPPRPVIIYDPLVLQEVTPLPRAAVIKQIVEYEPVYSVMRIIEVSEENGVQKYFLVRLGQDKTGITIGTTGDIAEDQEFQKIIGTYKIIELQSGFFRGQIESLTYKIGTNAFIRIKTGEKQKEK